MRDRDEAANGGSIEGAPKREWGPPSPYEEEDQWEVRRCIMAPICKNDVDSTMAIVVQVGGG